MLQVLFVFLTLALVIFLVFKKWNIILVSIVAAAVLAILDGQNILTALTDTFMSGASTYVKNFFLLFCVSALFGKVMEETGAAAAIAKWLTKLLGEKFAILGVFFAGMLLTYGGISALVIAFTMYPIALAVFKSANLPRRLIPGVIAAAVLHLQRLHFRVLLRQLSDSASVYRHNGECSAGFRYCLWFDRYIFTGYLCLS